MSEPVKVVLYGPPSRRRIVLCIDNQSFLFAYEAESQEEAQWYAKMLKVAFQKAGIVAETVEEY